MSIKRSTLISLSLFSFILISCGEKKHKSVSMALEEVILIKEFPKSITLDEGEVKEHTTYGAFTLHTIDTLLIISSNNSSGGWSFYSLNNDSLLGQYLKVGNAANEFGFIPTVNSGSTFTKDSAGNIITFVYDSGKKRGSKIDITTTLREKELKIEALPLTFPEGMSAYCTVIGEDSYVHRTFEPWHNQQNRTMVEKGEVKNNKFFDRLNQASVAPDGDINLLATNVIINRELDRIIEAPLRLNFLNIYSLTGDFGKTLCIEDELIEIKDEETKESSEKIFFHSSVKSYKDFWAVMCTGQSYTKPKGEEVRPKILLFDWDGNPLAELKLPKATETFTFDLINQKLYTLDWNSEELIRYDLDGIF